MLCIKVVLPTVSLKEKILPYLKQTNFSHPKSYNNNYPLISSIMLSSNFQLSHKFDSVSFPFLLVFCMRPPWPPSVSGPFWWSSTSGPLYWLFTQPGKPTPQVSHMAFIPTGCCPNITAAAGKRGEMVDSPGDQVWSTSPLIFPQ